MSGSDKYVPLKISRDWLWFGLVWQNCCSSPLVLPLITDMAPSQLVEGDQTWIIINLDPAQTARTVSLNSWAGQGWAAGTVRAEQLGRSVLAAGTISVSSWNGQPQQLGRSAEHLGRSVLAVGKYILKRKMSFRNMSFNLHLDEHLIFDLKYQDRFLGNPPWSFREGYNILYSRDQSFWRPDVWDKFLEGRWKSRTCL